MPDHFDEGLARLDPQDRALLELSTRRGLSDDEIADVLRVEPDKVARRRDEALERLAAILELRDADLEELRERLSRQEPEPEPDAEPEPEPDAEPEPEGRRLVGRTELVLGLVLLVVGVVLALVIASGGDDEPEPASTTAQTTPADTTEPAPETTPATATEATPEPEPEPTAGPARTMEILNDTNGRGTAQLVTTDGRTVLRLRLRDFLAPTGGGYAVWLYNSPDDARRLYATADTDFERGFRLPSDFERYRFVEVARAVPDLDSDHSGLSLLRASIAALKGRG